ncbi:hypothetical protein GALMADRAFT_81270 [Galerina marginata CBS 339.88]|uniref:Uncharacterized protein n=1 Tax=Galerina marginata (strain CBS 339.88) TaxID=685588 RepID=A0A067S7X5_GALM3|nr:hypothetical protein GALMADRAFT_81270 [Galerina marginata CBS 339.88]
MSGPAQNVGRTLTGGIQDVAVLLTLLGTDQCEQHVGSALDGGYLYAAAAPLSIFGSLDIVKVGISVLISSISITIPKISITLRPFSINVSQERWLGARTLNNAGFKPAGTVAPLIAMDGKRYKAETRLLQILEEKHIDHPETLIIGWKSREWNVMLALTTIVAAAISSTPYIALLLQKSQSTLIHTPWIFPLLRIVGSCLTAVSC